MIIKLFKSAILSCIITGQCIAMNHNQIENKENAFSATANDEAKKQELLTYLKKRIISFKEQITPLEKNEKITKFYVTDDKIGIVTSKNRELERTGQEIPNAPFMNQFVKCISSVFAFYYPNKEFKFYFEPNFIEHIDCHISTKSSADAKICKNSSSSRGKKSQINVVTFCKKLSETHINSPTVQLFKEFAKILSTKKEGIDKITYLQFALIFFDSVSSTSMAKFPSDSDDEKNKDKITIELRFDSKNPDETPYENSDICLRFAFRRITETETTYNIKVCSLYPISRAKVESNFKKATDHTINKTENKENNIKKIRIAAHNNTFAPINLICLLYILKDLNDKNTISKEQNSSLVIAFSEFLKVRLKEYRNNLDNNFFDFFEHLGCSNEIIIATTLSDFLCTWFNVCNKASDSSIFREAVLNHVLNGGKQKLSIFSEHEIKYVDRILGRDTLMPFALITCILQDKNLPTSCVQDRFRDSLIIEDKIKDEQKIDEYCLPKFNNPISRVVYNLLFSKLPSVNQKEAKPDILINSLYTTCLSNNQFPFDVTKVKQDETSLRELKNSIINKDKITAFKTILTKDKPFYVQQRRLLNEDLKHSYVEIDNILRVIYPEHSFFDFYSEEGGFKHIDTVISSGDDIRIKRINISPRFTVIFMSICAQIDLLNNQKKRYLSPEERVAWIKRINETVSKDAKGMEKHLHELAINLLKVRIANNTRLVDKEYVTFKRNLHNVLENAYKALLKDDTIKPIMYKKPDTQVPSDNPTQQENTPKIINKVTVTPQSPADFPSLPENNSENQNDIAVTPQDTPSPTQRWNGKRIQSKKGSKKQQWNKSKIQSKNGSPKNAGQSE